MRDTVLPFIFTAFSIGSVGSFIFAGFFIGFPLSLRFVQRPGRVLIWGLVLGVASPVLAFGMLNAAFGGMGDLLRNLVGFVLELLMLNLFLVAPAMLVASGAGFGMAGGAAVLWVGRERTRWVSWLAGAAVVGIAVVLALTPAALREVEKRQIAEHRNAIIRADFKGTLAGYQVAFPASPRLYLTDDCGPWRKVGFDGCSINLINPVTRLPGPDEKLLHERSDPINFNWISVSPVQPDCRRISYCLTQEKIDRWCGAIRPDQANSIWCRNTPPMAFYLRSDEAAKATTSSSNRDEPELATRYADTPLGPGQASCFYHPDPAETNQQGTSCRLIFNLVDRVKVFLPASRAQITSYDPALTATIALIPDYWAVLTGGQ